MPLAGAYDYKLPKGTNAARGLLVSAPLGPREQMGVVWGAAEARGGSVGTGREAYKSCCRRWNAARPCATKQPLACGFGSKTGMQLTELGFWWLKTLAKLARACA